MRLTADQKKIIEAYTDERYIDREKLISYLEEHKVVDAKVFEYSSKVKRDKHDFKVKEEGYAIGLSGRSYQYSPVNRDTFVQRIPFYFYIPDTTPYGPRITSITPMYEHAEEQLEAFYANLEFIFYEVGLPLKTIFSYPVEQANTPREIENDRSILAAAIEASFERNSYDAHIMFPQWIHYLHLCQDNGSEDYTPEHFITAYNHALENAGLQPIIYKPLTDYRVLMWREGYSYKCKGLFPCDNDNKPILRWTNIKVINPGEISFSGEKSWQGTLSIELTPKTKIYTQGMRDYKEDEDEDPMPEDEWYQVYAGPQNMDFDYEALKEARKNEGLTQKQLAEAIGVSERTYQKWEYGETIPDGYHLLRIMNWLDISNVQYFIKYTEPEV